MRLTRQLGQTSGADWSTVLVQDPVIDTSGLSYTPPSLSYDGSSSSSSSSSSSFTASDALAWLHAGLVTYAQFKDIQNGNVSAYTGQPVPTPEHAPPIGPDTGTPNDSSANQTGWDWHVLGDFTTPWPYGIGLAVVGGAWALHSYYRRKK